MKWNMLGALIVGICLTGQSYGFGLLDTMLGCGCGCDSCEPQCCCEKSCGYSDDCCDPGCGAADDCCDPGCGCADDCCGDGCCGGDSSEASDSDAASASASPIPPAPVADPNARIAQPRKVVSASFVR